MRPDAREDLPLKELRVITSNTNRELLSDGEGAYALSGREVRALATIGTFRAITSDDVVKRQLLTPKELKHLEDEGLVEAHAITRRGELRPVVTLSDRAQRLLEAHASGDATNPTQRFYAGLVKPSELSHDAELYALYEITAAELRAEGNQVERVVLDYELKADYQAFLNRPDRDPETTLAEDRQAWAEAHNLTLVDGNLHFPDLRVEYTGANGERGFRDVEFATAHYGSTTVEAKQRAGFAVFRHRPLRAKGSAVPDPNLFERLL